MNFKIFPYSLCTLLLICSWSCEKLDTQNTNNPDRSSVLTSGSDLIAVLKGGYIAWWQGVHDDHPVIGVSVAADIYSLSLNNFGAQRMGLEPRQAYNNRNNEEEDYKRIVEDPWFGCLSAVSSANDIILALQNGITIDNGGAQDQSILAAARFLRGVSWGYMGLIFEKGLLVDETTTFQNGIDFSNYQDIIARSVEELEEAIEIAESVNIDFVHEYFNGIQLTEATFTALAHSYAARFLAQWPRTPEESALVDWNSVLAHAEVGITQDFAPIADGNFWQSYHKYVFNETGQGPFWARVDQRIVSVLDPNQPSRYPEVQAKGDPALTNRQATSPDARLTTDFIFLPENNFPAQNGEWHFSHYKHNRNVSDPSFSGNGSTSGPMPTFRVADNELLEAEALLRLNRLSEATSIINNGTRVARGRLPSLNSPSSEIILNAILYERAIELLSTAPMGFWFDRRRTADRLSFEALDGLGGLQNGTPAHLPVPARELGVQGLPTYNIGGETDPLGITPIF